MSAIILPLCSFVFLLLALFFAFGCGAETEKASVAGQTYRTSIIGFFLFSVIFALLSFITLAVRA
jgi:hypothetical protein